MVAPFWCAFEDQGIEAGLEDVVGMLFASYKELIERSAEWVGSTGLVIEDAQRLVREFIEAVYASACTNGEGLTVCLNGQGGHALYFDSVQGERCQLIVAAQQVEEVSKEYVAYDDGLSDVAVLRGLTRSKAFADTLVFLSG